MTIEEAKQYIRNQIDSSLKTQDNYNSPKFYLCYNKQYVRALKLSTITGKPVNKENFKPGEELFCFNPNFKIFVCYFKIRNYLEENYSEKHNIQNKIIEDVFNEYEDYKGYKYYL